MRRTEQPRAAANALTSVVLATQGTPSSSVWPRASKLTNSMSTGAMSPMNTSAIARRTSPRVWRAASSSSVLRAAVTLRSLQFYHFGENIKHLLVQCGELAIGDAQRSGVHHRGVSGRQPRQQLLERAQRTWHEQTPVGRCLDEL